MNSFTQLMEMSPFSVGKVIQNQAQTDTGNYGHIASEKHALKVIFDDGDYLYTTINASRDEAYAYYMGKYFEKADETSHKVTKIEFLDDGDDKPEPYSRHRASAALYH